MKRTTTLLTATALLLLLLPHPVEAVAPVLNPDNGHYYEMVGDFGDETWEWANTEATARSHEGCPGHLVTITSAEEDAFLFDTFGQSLHRKWYGGLQDPPDEPSADEGWTWVTGEAWVYQNWDAQEPNDAAGRWLEQHLQGSINGTWNDSDYDFFAPEPSGYVVEYECGLNQPPTAEAGDDQLIEATSPLGAPVGLDGSQSSDPENGPLTYLWATNGSEIATGVRPEVTLPLGTHVIVLTVTDLGGASDSDQVEISVVDTTPPSLTVTVVPQTLWPANHRYVEIEVNIVVSDVADSAPDVRLVSATSDEPDNGPNDGNTVNDIVILDLTSVLLRAERSGTGDGRAYTLSYEATDQSGNATLAEVQVQVPLSMQKH